MSEFKLDDFDKKIGAEKENKPKRFSLNLYVSDFLDLQKFKNFKIQKDKDLSYTNSSVITYGLELLKEKYNIERGKEKIHLKKGTRKVEEKTRGTSIVLDSEWIDFINDFIYYKIFEEQKVEYTRAELIREIINLIKEKNKAVFKG